MKTNRTFNNNKKDYGHAFSKFLHHIKNLKNFDPVFTQFNLTLYNANILIIFSCTICNIYKTIFYENNNVT